MKDRNDELSNNLETLRQIQASAEETQSIPAGYITIELSTKGRLKCAPAKFHMRNFTTEGMIDLSMVQPEELPIKLADCLDDLIYEKDVSIRDFNEKEVIETLIILYRTFYSDKLENLDYTPTEADWDFIASQNGGTRDSDEFRRAQRNLQGTPLKFFIDLNKVEFDEVPEDFHPVIKVKKGNGITYKFGIPKYGDAITVAEYTKKKWEQKDRQFEHIARTLKFRQDNEDRWRRGENINISSLPVVSQKDQDAYYEYSREKTKDMMRCFKTIHLLEAKGQDCSEMKLDQKFILADDPELDHVTFQGVLDFFQSQKFGVRNTVKITNPVTGMQEDYEYPFRVDALVQAFYSSKPATTTYEFE